YLIVGQPGRYNLFSGGNMQAGNAVVLADTSTKGGSLEAVYSTGIMLNAQFWMSDTSRINVAFGQATTDWPSPLDTAGRIETWTTLHLNYITNVSKAAKIGVEYITKTIERNDAAATEGSNSRIQFSVQVGF
ncbi:MAG: hypothetical protein IIC13_08375, partial [SAR324 cluster bacterium]|nr:hypothetical protein [SAR324 cluster bacterium]